MISLIWDQREVAFAHGCAGSCACSDPAGTPREQDYLITPEPEALEAGMTEHIQKKQIAFVSSLFKLPSRSVLTKYYCVLKDKKQCCFTYG